MKFSQTGKIVTKNICSFFLETAGNMSRVLVYFFLFKVGRGPKGYIFCIEIPNLFINNFVYIVLYFLC